MQQQITVWIRTAAQAAAGLIAVYLLKVGVDIDSTALETMLAALFAGAWAFASKWLAENVHPAFSYMSVAPSTPSYDKP